jgi:hypothetical protein
MAADPHDKSVRQFQCRNYLWDAFEQMSHEYDCTPDSLINEAMRQFAHSRNRGGPYAEQAEPMEPLNAQRGGFPGRPGGMPAQPPGMGGGGMPGMRPPGQMPQQPPGMPPQPPGMGGGMPGMRPPGQMPQQPPGMAPPGMAPPGMAPPGRPGMAPMQPPGMAPSMAPRLPSMQGAMQPQGAPGGMPGMQRPGAPGGMPPAPRPPAPAPAPPPQRPPMQQPGRAPTQGRTLIALFEGQQYPVTKEEFVIGRGQKTSDLTIRDSNVSRRHACVVLYNGQYWIVDQQSTNGVEFNGGKVDRKVIEDGDLYRICDHEIQFVYR